VSQCHLQVQPARDRFVPAVLHKLLVSRIASRAEGEEAQAAICVVRSSPDMRCAGQRYHEKTALRFACRRYHDDLRARRADRLRASLFLW